jgi:hypothetical protein
MATFLKEKIFLGTKSLRGDNPRPRRRVAAAGAGAGVLVFGSFQIIVAPKFMCMVQTKGDIMYE